MGGILLFILIPSVTVEVFHYPAFSMRSGPEFCELYGWKRQMTKYCSNYGFIGIGL